MMNSILSRALILTLLFSFSLCLAGPIGSHGNDPLSQWLTAPFGSPPPQGYIALEAVPQQTASPFPSWFLRALELIFSLVTGATALLVTDRLALPRALAAAGVLLFVCLGLPVLLFIVADILIASSVPLLSAGFGFTTGLLLLKAPPLAPDDTPSRLGDPPDEINKPDANFTIHDSHEQKTSNHHLPNAAQPNGGDGDKTIPATCMAIGRYEIIRSIGKGAMGEVFLGRDPNINRLTAIKTVHFEETFGADDIQDIKGKFFREAESAGTLSHPHIVTIYDAGEDGDSAYIAMEFLEGSTLLRFSRRRRLLPLRRFMRYMVQVAEALEYAHSQGVIHRDIKPANIMVVPSDQIKITDFGIAHIATSSQTQTGVVKGTPYYMSPEQFSGQKVDGRSDIFSLGTTMFQLLTGTLPFYAESPALLMNQIMNFPHPNPRAINPRIIPAMVAIVDKALAKDRDSRYQTAKALAQDLRRLDARIKTALRKERMRTT